MKLKHWQIFQPEVFSVFRSQGNLSGFFSIFELSENCLSKSNALFNDKSDERSFDFINFLNVCSGGGGDLIDFHLFCIFKHSTNDPQWIPKSIPLVHYMCVCVGVYYCIEGTKMRQLGCKVRRLLFLKH
jgi:hypothetical protein